MAVQIERRVDLNPAAPDALLTPAIRGRRLGPCA
jgi:hypothetical protein